MIYLLLQECLWVFSVISLLFIYSFRGLRRTMSVVVSARDSSSSSSSSSLSAVSPCLWSGNGKCFGHSASGGGDIPETVITESKRLKVDAAAAGGSSCCQETMLMDSIAMARASSLKVKKRPARLVLPEQRPSMTDFSKMGRSKVDEKEEFEDQGRDYFLASKKGRRDVMEDGYGVILDISGDPKQAFFTVIDGHGGRAAADYVAENLGKNIVRAIRSVEEEEEEEAADTYNLEQAIRGGYLVTDEEFLSKGETGGACAASVLLKDGELHAANVGDCRVVLSRKGVAVALTSDHRPSWDGERRRIESSGGFVHLRNGTWRVQGSLAISRAIGDIHLKEWIISEPEIRKLQITPDCEFLILASDGLWDKVSSQEAVDVVSRERSLQDSCKRLIEMSSRRGNLDDVTVMVIDLESFVDEAGR